jgi:cell division septum initiation protein DivIVA
MCKQAEIDALTRFIESLPRASYLRPWLEDVLPQVRADIRNDLPVAPCLTETRKEAAAILAAAHQQAADVVAKAQTEAERVTKQARDHFHALALRARVAIYEAERALEKI